MKRTEVLNFLNRVQISYQLKEHPEVETIAEIDLLLLQKDKKISLKELRTCLNTRPLSFASEEDLFHFLGLQKGSVTPLGILNDEMHEVNVLMDSETATFPVVGVHPNDNTATVWLSPKDLQTIIETHGNLFPIVEIK